MKSKIAPRSQSQLDASISLEGVSVNAPSDDWSGGGKKRQRTNAEIEHQTKVAELGCIVCKLRLDVQQGDTYIHHVRVNAKRHDNHFNVLPLCHADHVGRFGVHGDKSRLRDTGKTELELLDIVKGLL